MTNIEIVNLMVENGYCLMNRTAEEMANLFDNETLQKFLDNFLSWKEKA